MEEKPQIMMIHGGTTFTKEEDYLKHLINKKVSLDNKDSWQDHLVKELEDEFLIIRPRMPLKENARYKDWKIIFEKYVPLLREGVTFIGVSLGGIFLAKWLSENRFLKKIKSVYLVAPPFDNSLPGEELVGGFCLRDDLSLFEKNCQDINLLFSRKDDCVPVAHSEKYKERLPNAKIHIYDDIEGHFFIPEFPEIINMIRRK